MKLEIRDTETVSNPCGARDARLGDRFTISPIVIGVIDHHML